MKLSLDYAGDAYPAQEPQAEEDRSQLDDLQGPEVYKFLYTNGQLEVAPENMFSHDDLAGHAGIDLDHTGPMAVGYVSVSENRATWDVQANISLQSLHRILKDYTKHVGWKWGGLCDIEGEPIGTGSEFAPVKSHILFRYDREDDHLYLARTSKMEGPHGSIMVIGSHADVAGLTTANFDVIKEWSNDEGLILTAGDNVIKRIEDLEQFNRGDLHDWDIHPESEPVVREPSGVYKCPACGRLFPSYWTFTKHRLEEEPPGEPEQDGEFPEVDRDQPLPAHFTEQQPFVFPVAHVAGNTNMSIYEARVNGETVGRVSVHDGAIVSCTGDYWSCLRKIRKHSEKEPRDMINDSIPFIFDVEEDEIFVGEPGSRTSDIPGRFTPGGIVEGTYEPGGKVFIRTMTNMPYTVRHMVELWYWTHPHLEVKSVHLQDDAGRDTKLASSVGGYLTSLVAANPAVHAAMIALQQAGGRVYVVGGAVRDALMGKEPKDIDLLVGSLPEKVVEKALKLLPGKTDITGKSFGVFRYKQDGEEVEIALPRKERSIGVGHKDFAIHADPGLSVEEDLSRRDFTANAMALDLSNQKLIDPFDGATDVREGILRAVRPEALAEDPLRVLRAVVAQGRHGLEPDENTRQAMQENATSLEALPADRLQVELDKLLAANDPVTAIRLAHETGVLRYLLPEVDAAFGFDQKNPRHSYDLGTHLLNVLDGVARQTDDVDVRLAALLHDIGKPHSQWVDDDGVAHYYYNKETEEGDNHEEVGAMMAVVRLRALRFPEARIQRIKHLIEQHMFPAFTTNKGARKFIYRVGDQHADDLLTLRHADMYGKGSDDYQNLLTPVDEMREYVNTVRQTQEPTDRSQLAIDGNDLIAAGIPPGPEMGQILQRLTDAVLDDPQLNDRDTLLTLALQ